MHVGQGPYKREKFTHRDRHAFWEGHVKHIWRKCLMPGVIYLEAKALEAGRDKGFSYSFQREQAPADNLISNF